MFWSRYGETSVIRVARSALVVGLLGALLSPAASASADQAYVQDPADLRGDMTVLRLSADGRQLRFVSAHVLLCASGSRDYINGTARVVRKRPVKLPDGVPVVVTAGVSAGQLTGKYYFLDKQSTGVETHSGKLQLRSITAKSMQGSWSVSSTWSPRTGKPVYCRDRKTFTAVRDGKWFAGETSDAEPVAIHDEGAVAYGVFAYWAFCRSDDFMWGIEAFPMEMGTDLRFGWTTPLVTTVQQHPGSVVMNGRIAGPSASGAFRASAIWDGDPCDTGPLTWKARTG